MTFRRRLVLFLVLALTAIQGVTALIVYDLLRRDALHQGEVALANAADAFQRQIDLISHRVTDDVAVLSLDYALRQAIGKNDHATELSALANHGNRVGATRMLLVGLDGRIEADTTTISDTSSQFPFPDLIATAYAHHQGAALAALGGKIYWIAVSPVLAPVPIAFIAACVPIDNALLESLRGLSSAPRAIALAVKTRLGWRVAAKTSDFTIPQGNGGIDAEIGTRAKTVRDAGKDLLASSTPLATAGQSAPVAVIFTYPLSDAIAAYSSLSLAMLGILSAGLICTIAGAMLIARSLSRPLEGLATHARRIAAGDYRAPDHVGARDEIGSLSDALIAMTESISSREVALTDALSTVEFSRSEAERANEAKSQFLANMSHELRTPLNGILGFSDILQQEMLGPLGTPAYGEYARDIHTCGQRLLKLVEETMALAGKQGTAFTIENSSVDLSAILEDALAAFSNVAAKAKVAIIKRAMPTLPNRLGDGVKLRQAFGNLIHNAIKFTDPGGRVDIGMCENCGTARITITDTGIGMRPEDIALVVKPFHRLRSAIDGRHQGAGIGLPFAKAVIECHGGTLSIHSSPGEGTRVTVDIPLQSANLASDAA